jgi:hypothetical protein
VAGHDTRMASELLGAADRLDSTQLLEAFKVHRSCRRASFADANWTALGALTLLWLVLEAGVLFGSPPALASTAGSAVFSGGAGTVSVGGTLYARAGGTLTLTVATSSDTRCVDVVGAFTAHQTSATGKSSWTFTTTAPTGTGNGVQTATATASPTVNPQDKCTGASGNAIGSYILDNAGPVVTAALSPAANSAGWNKDNVSVTWSAADAGSGVASGPTPATDAQTVSTAGVTKTASATDRLGNTGNGAASVKLDKTAPTISGTRAPSANANGWNNSDVIVSFACSDGLSGIKDCTAPRTVSSTDASGLSVSGTAVDVADNTATTSVGPVKVDKVAPTLSGAPTTAPNGDGWYDGPVTIHWAAGDAGSGLAAPAPADSTLGGEGTNQFDTKTVSDKAGNATAADSAPRVNIDRTAPATNVTAPQGWNQADVAVTLAPTDNLSGVKTTNYTVDGGAVQSGTTPTLTGDGTHSLVFWSTDKAGNEEQHKTIEVKIDGTAPTIDVGYSRPFDAPGWYRDNVTVRFSCQDATSGIASCGPDQVVSAEGKDQDVTGTAKDNAGNTATAHGVVSLDRTKPEIAASADRQPNANLWYDDDVTITFAATDALSGIDVLSAPVTLGEGRDQSASGKAVDKAGNEAGASLTGINVDKTAPTLIGKATSEPNAAGWYSGDVTVHWTADDALSGLDGAVPGDSTLEGEGEALSASVTVSDKAGNSRTETVKDIKIDRTAPSTSAKVGDPLESGWYAGGVDVTLTGRDNLSGVRTTYYKVDDGTALVYAGPFKHTAKGTHTITFWSVDRAGNAEAQDDAHSLTLKIDDVAPSVSGSQTPAANTNGWNNTAVAVSFKCDDAESGIATCVGATTLNDETPTAGTTVTGNAQDNAGNTAEATVGPIKIDLTAPDVAAQLPDPQGVDTAGAKWYRGDVAVAWPCSDGLSGIDGSCPAASPITGEGRNLAAGPVSVSDKAGNSRSASASGVNIDRKGPSISGSATTAPNAAGWYSGPVKLAFSCADPNLADGTDGSGVAKCPSDIGLTDEGANQSATSEVARDYAGNETAGRVVGGIKIDNTAPTSTDTVQCTLVNGFCNGLSPVSLKIDAIDQAGLSGVKEIRYSTDGEATYKTASGASATVPLNLDVSGQATVTYYAVDNAGNQEAKHADSINYDGTAPTLTHKLTPAANAADWSNADTLVHFDAVDDAGGSGVDLTSVTADKTYATETAGQMILGEAKDKAGNAGKDSFSLKLDKTAPKIVASRSPATANANGWNTTPVTVEFKCEDPNAANGALGAGISACPDPVTLSTNNKSGSPQSVTRSVRDLADNSASAGVQNVNIDMEKPTVTVGGVKDDGSYVLGAVPAATCSASDDFSGLDGACKTTLTGGQANGVGTFTYAATATDRAGNVTMRSVTYKVIYAEVQGTPFWMPPINDTAHTTSTTTSVFKAGSTVPAKFQLRDANGKIVQTNTPPVWVQPAKGVLTTAPVDESAYSAPAESGTTYRWSATDQQYIYNWNTDKSQIGYFWRIAAKLDDGTTRTVNIGLR